MLPLGIHHDDVSDSEIIKYCSDPNRQIIGGSPYGNLVIRISDQAVVKFGLGVTREEAENQKKAFDLLGITTVRVPRVYRYFNESGPPGYPPRGYIVMEYIDGKVLESIDDLGYITQIADILSGFSTIHSQVPGPFQKGSSRGLLWSESGEPCFTTLHEMECWLNYRLPGQDSKLALQAFPLVMCHLDLAPRNVLWLKDGSVCLIDWATAGFYPRFFEVCVLMINSGKHGKFEELLLQNMEDLTEEEEVQLWLLMRSFQNSLRYHFSPRMI